MLSTYIAYGLILGRSATILASLTFRRQNFKQRFAIIRKYLVRSCCYITIQLCTCALCAYLQKKACIKEELQNKVVKYYEFMVREHVYIENFDHVICCYVCYREQSAIFGVQVSAHIIQYHTAYIYVCSNTI